MFPFSLKPERFFYGNSNQNRCNAGRRGLRRKFEAAGHRTQCLLEDTAKSAENRPRSPFRMPRRRD
nr:MAG TPA: hypothetical protein [Caudoviricetes sp.]